MAPVLKEDGPLATSDVVSKLMFAMGKISLETYADIGLYDQVGSAWLANRRKSNSRISMDIVIDSHIQTIINGHAYSTI